jgi:hypothetical protein
VTTAKCLLKISAPCLAEYQKIRRAKLMISLVTLVGCERIQREIEEYSRLSQQVMQLTKTISESVEKVRASADRPARVAQEKE